MLDVLMVRIQPTDIATYNHLKPRRRFSEGAVHVDKIFRYR